MYNSFRLGMTSNYTFYNWPCSASSHRGRTDKGKSATDRKCLIDNRFFWEDSCVRTIAASANSVTTIKEEEPEINSNKKRASSHIKQEKLHAGIDPSPASHPEQESGEHFHE